MNIYKIIKQSLRFYNDSICDVYMASTLYKYISEKSPELKDSIGYDDSDNPNGISDFIYTCMGNETEIIKKIEENIDEFLNNFKLVSNMLEVRCIESLIEDDVEFYEQFKSLSKVMKHKQNLENNLMKKDEVKSNKAKL